MKVPDPFTGEFSRLLCHPGSFRSTKGPKVNDGPEIYRGEISPVLLRSPELILTVKTDTGCLEFTNRQGENYIP